MARLQIVLWSGGGNVNPFLLLAAEMVSRGHQVDALGPADLRASFDEQGASFTACADWLPTADELLRTVETASPDVLIVDFMANETLAGAEATGLPTVVLVHTLLDANRVGDDIAPMWMLGPASLTDDTRTRLGLRPATSHNDLLEFADTLLVAAPELLEPPGARDPRTVYAGPLYVTPKGGDLSAVPDDDRPLIVGCAGTASTDPEREPELLQRMVDAIARLGHRGLVTVPSYLGADAVHPRPGVAVTEFVSHAPVLPHAAAFVTHAGLGSVCAAIVAGTPMVCLPLGREQPSNAAAVARVGAGIDLDPSSSVDEIAGAINRVIGSPMPEVDVDPLVAVAEIERLAPAPGAPGAA